MKTVVFTPQNEEEFKMVYEGLAGSPRGYSETELRVINRVQDKLEGIGIPVEGEENRATFALLPDGGKLELEDAEFKLLMDALRKVRWMFKAARSAEKMYKLLEDGKPADEPMDE